MDVCPDPAEGLSLPRQRAQIAERCRRGKLHRARAGAVSVLSNAPYGYRYVKRTEHADAFFEIDELEAPTVREIFDRYVERRESIVEIGRSLTEQGVPTRTGTAHWGSSTIWAILRNPAYNGLAAYGRRRVTGEPAKPMRMTRQRGRHSGRSAYEHVAPELDALDAELYDAETYLKLTETLDAFRARLSANAENLTVEQRQEIVRLVVREVLLGDDDVTVRHSIPIPTGGQPNGSVLHSQIQSDPPGDQGRVRRARARAPLSPAQGAQRDRPAPRARPPGDPRAHPRRVGAQGPRVGRAAARPARFGARADVA